MTRKRCICWNSVKRCPVHPTSVEFRLQYIADSPAEKYGGFDAKTVLVAKDALRLIRKLRKVAER